MVRDAAYETAEWGCSKIAAPHHEAGRGRNCIKRAGIHFDPARLTQALLVRAGFEARAASEICGEAMSNKQDL